GWNVLFLYLFVCCNCIGNWWRLSNCRGSAFRASQKSLYALTARAFGAQRGEEGAGCGLRPQPAPSSPRLASEPFWMKRQRLRSPGSALRLPSKPILSFKGRRKALPLREVIRYIVGKNQVST